MAKQAKKVYRFVLWFFSTVIASGSLAGCGMYGPPPVAMYGPPPRDYYTINGRVLQENGEGIQSIKVTVTETSDIVFTTEDGSFKIENIGVMDKDRVTITFEDIDGEENGGEFESQALIVEDFSLDTVDIEMERKDD